MIAARPIAASALLLVCLAPRPADAERLVISLSTHRVLISSNFTGANLTLFGAIEQDARSVGRAGGYGIVVSVIGPRQTVVTWRKERMLGVWVNARSRTFPEPPSYLAVLANRPIESIASPDVLRRFRIGLRNFLLPQEVNGDIGEVGAEDPFRQAFVRLKVGQQLYRERGNAVTFITPSLFRAAIPLPATVPIGDYEVDVKLFADGVMIAHETTAFEIIKTGFEQLVAQAARDHSLLYGLATAALALLTGWLGSIVFRRD
ncbi:MAG TPA: TIGR02186 family protein [Xanthobacteraceae bacterium]|nr:TIGR02186 family protein [Xanthobacteraceae bacterium]